MVKGMCVRLKQIQKYDYSKEGTNLTKKGKHIRKNGQRKKTLAIKVTDLCNRGKPVYKRERLELEEVYTVPRHSKKLYKNKL